MLAPFLTAWQAGYETVRVILGSLGKLTLTLANRGLNCDLLTSAGCGIVQCASGGEVSCGKQGS
jgi:hypothetical protein